MTKLSRKQMDPEKFSHYVNNLWSAFTLMDSKEDTRLLFKDLFTRTEYQMFAKRLEIARRLFQGERYDDIILDLKVTPNTINRISEVLSERGEGFRKAHEKLEELEDQFLQSNKNQTKNLENPLRGKLKRKTLGGALLKAGIRQFDKVVARKLKQRSAKNPLDL